MTQAETVADHHYVNSTQNNSSVGFVIGAIILLIAVIFFIIYGIPMIQNSMQSPTINVPDKVDVNINK